MIHINQVNALVLRAGEQIAPSHMKRLNEQHHKRRPAYLITQSTTFDSC